jgi:hypothetical protein
MNTRRDGAASGSGGNARRTRRGRAVSGGTASSRTSGDIAVAGLDPNYQFGTQFGPDIAFITHRLISYSGPVAVRLEARI